MSGSRKTLFVQTTPVPGFDTVTMFEDSWSCHILEHPEMNGQEDLVRIVLSDPEIVYSGGTAHWNTVFINSSVCNSDKAPVLVAVNTKNKTVASAYFKDRFKDFKESMLPKEVVVKWRK